jgi:FMN-dependent NADH-azoreductase
MVALCGFTGPKDFIMKLLHIDSSILGAHSVSRQLTRDIVSQWRASHPGTVVDYLDLAVDTPNHLSADSIGFRAAPGAAPLTEVQERENAVSEALVSQLLAADVIVLGAPLYNFSIPSQLKAWIDRRAAWAHLHLHRQGPQGLATGKTVIIASSRGGSYSTTEAGRALEHQESYLKTVLGFIGITDVRFVRAEGLAMGDTVTCPRRLVSAQSAIRAHTGVAANESQAAEAA